MISSIYTSFDNHLPRKIDTGFQQVVEQGIKTHGSINVFFRADDIGVPSKNHSRIVALFIKYNIPLCLAVVPSWLTLKRWEAMKDSVKNRDDLFCWHMHGFRHRNHETVGKKQEFGPSRSYQALFYELSHGYARLQSIIGQKLTPVFTPPWNRCSLETMRILKDIGFKGVSRSIGSVPMPPKGIEDFPIHVDLHTRKEKESEKGWQKMLTELQNGLSSSACGIMIHHMRMNDQAFVFLEYLLALISKNKQIKTLTYEDLI